MLILDLDYLDSVSQSNAINLHGGGKAKAISAWSTVGIGESSSVFAIVKNQAVVDKNRSYASSSVIAAAYGDKGSSITAFSFASASSEKEIEK